MKYNSLKYAENEEKVSTQKLLKAKHGLKTKLIGYKPIIIKEIPLARDWGL